MEFLQRPINREKQMSKIIEDTEEIISNFRQISTIIIENLGNDSENTMYNLGKKLINYREDNENPEDNLGNSRISII